MKKRLFSVLKYCTAATLVVALVTGLVKTGFNLEPKKAKAAGTSSVMGSDNYVAQADIEVGKTYRFGGDDWIAAEASGNLVVLQSKGVTSGYWPGAKIWGDGHSYGSSIDGQDISGYDTKTQNLYNNIKYAECGSQGLFLVSKEKARQTSNGNQESGNYLEALKDAAINYSSFGADNGGKAWLGTVSGSNVAWSVNSDGYFNSTYDQDNSFVIAPAFNLDKSKVSVNSENEIVPFSASTGIKATKNLSNLSEREKV